MSKLQLKYYEIEFETVEELKSILVSMYGSLSLKLKVQESIVKDMEVLFKDYKGNTYHATYTIATDILKEIETLLGVK